MLVKYDQPKTRAVLRGHLIQAMKARRNVGRQCSNELFAEAVEALGYWVKWRLRSRESVAACWSDAGEAGFVTQLTAVVNSVSEAITAHDRWIAENWHVKALSGTEFRVEPAVLAELLRSRMWADAVQEGLETILELMPQEAGGSDRSHVEHGSTTPLVESQDKLAKAIYDFDRALQHHKWEICGAAQTGLLTAMRAPFPGTAWLPWWLSGTLEVISLAASTPARHRLRESESAHGAAMWRTEYAYRMEQISQECVYSFHGQGIPVEEPIEITAPDGKVWSTYSWQYDIEAGPRRIRLVVPRIDSGRRQLELLLIGAEATTQKRRDGLRQSGDSGRGQELVGRMMFLNGLMFRWCSVGEGQTPKAILSERSPSRLPDKGQLILVDCQAGKALNPATGG